MSIIAPLVGQTSSFVKDSRHFVRMVRGDTIRTEEKLVSYDVESLFTNITVEESIMIIRRYLQQDTTVEERTSLSRNTIVDLLELCLTPTSSTDYYQLPTDGRCSHGFSSVTNCSKHLHGGV